MTLEERLQRLEDQIEIYQVVCGYGYAMDGLNTEALGQIYAEDGVYAISDFGVYEGRAAVQEITRMPVTLDMVGGGAAHMSTLPFVVIEGDRAVATCHTMVVRHLDDGFVTARLSASRIELARRPGGGWHITRRTNQVLDGDARGPAMLGRLMEIEPESDADVSRTSPTATG